MIFGSIITDASQDDQRCWFWFCPLSVFQSSPDVELTTSDMAHFTQRSHIYRIITHTSSLRMQSRRNVTPTDLYISSAFLLFSEFLGHVALSMELLVKLR